MAREQIVLDAEVENTVSLDDLIRSYGRNNANLKEVKAVVDADNSKIKAIMREREIKDYQVDDWKATYSVQRRESMNEDKLLDVLKKNWTAHNGSMQCPYIKTKEYVDFDILEDAIYRNELSNEVLMEMDTCKEVKEVETLKVSKVKEKK